ncbi:Glyoxalase/bleomycin resistance protein/dioxygenase [Sphingobium chlorophenolicum L-1]|uniref:Glyoxalase/bleomycin resistance protein/dioxygenase n=1 Tax=Sphingobium chlorophenolicum L-1 TaxID=690566 RepID=F6F396_SPHCR|nr:VOC family protein [Sphingobium chlorophenolicum]AEG50908.1 Glyoxalase/bleomycin resistance protein/dioxygenase [Sphingobium chlorophenolicum L-1]
MKFHHMCIMVSDIDEALALWRDVMGFQVIQRRITPDGEMVDQKTMDDIVRVKDAQFEMTLLMNAEGTMMEINRTITPKLVVTPRSELGYDRTGIRELGLEVSDIDHWFEKIRAAGYETQTEYVWNAGVFGRSFLFFDQDGNLIQLFERSPDVQLEEQPVLD